MPATARRAADLITVGQRALSSMVNALVGLRDSRYFGALAFFEN
jgi:hypothetical protein